MSVNQMVFLAVIGVVAGAINAVAGGGTLLAFPAMLAAGHNPIVANMSTATGLLAGYVGGTFAYRRELEGQRDRVWSLGYSAVIGAAAGALLLLVTPNHVFKWVAPVLVLVSCLTLIAQEDVARWLMSRTRSDRRWRRIHAHAGVLAGSLYGGFFAAGLGVVLLAILGLVVDDSLHRINALKGVLSLLIGVAGVLIFALSGHVVWWAAAVLSVTSLLGGLLGVSLARLLSSQGLRWTVVSYSFVSVGIMAYTLVR